MVDPFHGDHGQLLLIVLRHRLHDMLIQLIVVSEQYLDICR
jgi:hypothetical protein